MSPLPDSDRVNEHRWSFNLVLSDLPIPMTPNINQHQKQVPPIDSVIVVSFGGPEGPDDVLPFLENVTKGRNVPQERLTTVAQQYLMFDGISPINRQNRELIAALKNSLAGSAIDLPVYWGNRNWHPLLAETAQGMASSGHRHALAITTSAFGSFSGCKQYQNDLIAATESTDGELLFTKARLYWNDPEFLNVFAGNIAAALSKLDLAQRQAARLIFTAHSIPEAWVETSPYVSQLQAAASYLAHTVAPNLHWDMVYQSRSGSPQDPWLGPDILDHLQEVDREGSMAVVVIPLGFVSDHMEVKFDLDIQAQRTAQDLGLTMVRAATPSAHPTFVKLLHRLVNEQIEAGPTKSITAVSETWPNPCAVECCNIPQQQSSPSPN